MGMSGTGYGLHGGLSPGVNIWSMWKMVGVVLMIMDGDRVHDTA